MLKFEGTSDSIRINAEDKERGTCYQCAHALRGGGCSGAMQAGGAGCEHFKKSRRADDQSAATGNGGA